MHFTRTELIVYARQYSYERKRWIGDTRVSQSGDRWWYSMRPPEGEKRTEGPPEGQKRPEGWKRAEATFQQTQYQFRFTFLPSFLPSLRQTFLHSLLQPLVGPFFHPFRQHMLYLLQILDFR